MLKHVFVEVESIWILTLSGQVVMSVSRVQPPQVHQQLVALAALAVSDAQLPSLDMGTLGMVIPDLATSEIHCCTRVEFVGGTLSSSGKPSAGANAPTKR